MVIEHGWVEKDGVIIDPTLPDDDLDYFPGLRFKGQRGLAKAMKIPKPKRTREDFPIFYRFGWGGIDSPEFRASLDSGLSVRRDGGLGEAVRGLQARWGGWRCGGGVSGEGIQSQKLRPYLDLFDRDVVLLGVAALVLKHLVEQVRFLARLHGRHVLNVW